MLYTMVDLVLGGPRQSRNGAFWWRYHTQPTV